jgi:hypothetical protein
MFVPALPLPAIISVVSRTTQTDLWNVFYGWSPIVGVLIVLFWILHIILMLGIASMIRQARKVLGVSSDAS